MPIQISLSNAIGALQGLAGGGPGPGPGPTPPLDTYTGAAAAYSVRLLRTAYTGVPIRVRRDTAGGTGDDDMADISFDSGIISLDSAISNASAGVTATTLGQFLNVGTVNGTTYTDPDSLIATASCYVSKMYDQTGNGRDATAAATKQMLVHNGTQDTDLIQLNGKPSMQSGRVVYSFTGATASNTFAVTAVVSAGIQEALATLYGNPFGNNGASFATNNTLNVLAGSATNMNARYSEIGQMALLIYGTGSGYYVRVDGRAEVNNTETTALTLGNFGGPSYGLWRGNVQDFIVWDSFDDANVLGLESNLNSYYQIANFPDYTSGFLADYPNAAVAYSVRKLSNTAIKCMRVRRAVPPYDEQDIGFTAGGDLDEAAIVAFGGSDELRVSAWYDQSGQQNHATQIAPSSQPQIYNGTAVIIENGKPALNFQNDVVYTSSNITLSDGAFFGVSVGTTNGGENNNLYSSDGSPRVGQFLRASISNAIQSIGFTSSGSAVTATGPSVGVDTQFLGVAECTGTVITAYANGTGGTSRNLTNRTDAAPLYVGSRAAPGGTHNGYIQEVIHYPNDQSSNRTAIETDINTYYDIY